MYLAWVEGIIDSLCLNVTVVVYIIILYNWSTVVCSSLKMTGSGQVREVRSLSRCRENHIMSRQAVGGPRAGKQYYNVATSSHLQPWLT